MKTLVFIKTETNGLPKKKTSTSDIDHKDWPNIISLYYKIGKFNKNTRKVDLSIQSYHIIKPTFKINKYSQKIHEISEDTMKNEGEDIKDVLNKFNNDLIENEVKVIIGHNVMFDFNMIKAEILRNSLSIKLDYQIVDTMTLNHSLNHPKLEDLYFELYKRKFRKSHKRKSLINIIIACFEYLYNNPNSQ